MTAPLPTAAILAATIRRMDLEMVATKEQRNLAFDGVATLTAVMGLYKEQVSLLQGRIEHLELALMNALDGQKDAPIKLS